MYEKPELFFCTDVGTAVTVVDDILLPGSGFSEPVQALIHNKRQVGIELTCLLKIKWVISLPHILNSPIIRIEILMKGGLMI